MGQEVEVADWPVSSTAIGRMFFQILGSIAEFEHALMSERSRDGLAAARARGRTGGQRSELGLAEDLRKVGHTVAVELEETLRPAADVETDRQGRAEARAEALVVKAARKEAGADTANQRMRSILDALPPGGEPVKIGHRCQGRHRRGAGERDPHQLKNLFE